MLARSPLLVGLSCRPEPNCSILSIWRRCLDHAQDGRLPCRPCIDCSITKRRWNIHEGCSSTLRDAIIWSYLLRYANVIVQVIVGSAHAENFCHFDMYFSSR